MRGMRAVRMIASSSQMALGILMVLGLTAGSALALPTVDSSAVNSSIGNVTIISPAQVEQINVNGSSERVFMGPYNVPNPTFADIMMCFNAAATAGKTETAWATNTAGAAELFGTEKMNMIAWLASQWVSSNPLADGKNADINKAMWEIMTDYGSAVLTVDGQKDGTGTNPDLRGKFFLNTLDPDIGAVDKLVADALAYASIYTEANFLIPLSCDSGKCSYDTRLQPFVQPVPEPGTLLLLGSGLTGLGLFGWRKRSRAKR